MSRVVKKETEKNESVLLGTTTAFGWEKNLAGKEEEEEKKMVNEKEAFIAAEK